MPRRFFGRVFIIVLSFTLLLCGCGGGESRSRGPTPTPQPISEEITFEKIRQMRKDAVKVSEWEKYRDEHWIGKRIEWTGRVLFVIEPETKGNPYEIRMELDPPETLFVHYDVSFYLPQEEATSLEKGQEITFQGDIKRIRELGGTVDIVLIVELENVRIVED